MEPEKEDWYFNIFMETDNKQTNTEVVTAPASTTVAVDATAASRDNRSPRGKFSGGNRPDRKKGGRDERVRSEFDQKMLAIRRVTRVASGGRRFSFSVALVVGNKKGSVGVGTGKAGDTSLAIDKAAKNAKKNLVKLSLTKTSSIPYEIRTKYSSARVLVMPAPRRGLIAGSAVRDVLELAGVRDVVGKVLSGSKNKLNIARATVQALSEFAKSNSEVVAAKPKDGEVVLNQVN